MKLKPYPEYKDSGVEWLGKVPNEWKVCSSKRIISAKSGVDVKSESGEIPLYGANGIIGYSDTMSQPEGALLIGRVGSAGELTLANEGCAVSDNALIINSIDSIERPYIFHVLKSLNLEADISKNAQPLITATTLLNKVVTIPLSQMERIGITNFLDRETGKLDTLISKQGHLIELLQEKRQAIISHAVTKGLNPDAKMKDSGVEWLGVVPEHWEVKRLGYLTKKIGSGKTPLGGADSYSTEGILFIRSQNVYDDGLRLDDVVFISEKIDSDMQVSRVLPGDILLNITGASIGRTCLVPDNFKSANVNQHVCIIRLIDEKNSCYVSLIMKSSAIKSQIDFSQNGAGREGLNFPQIANLSLAVPPGIEQLEIMRYLSVQSTKIDTLIDKAKRSIELAKEHRTALISAAVTGKIDVREAA